MSDDGSDEGYEEHHIEKSIFELDEVIFGKKIFEFKLEDQRNKNIHEDLRKITFQIIKAKNGKFALRHERWIKNLDNWIRDPFVEEKLYFKFEVFESFDALQERLMNFQDLYDNTYKMAIKDKLKELGFPVYKKIC